MTKRKAVKVTNQAGAEKKTVAITGTPTSSNNEAFIPCFEGHSAFEILHAPCRAHLLLQAQQCASSVI